MNLTNRFLQWGEAIGLGVWYTIFPPICFACKNYAQPKSVLCDFCIKQIHPIVPKLIPITQKYVMTVYAVSRYTDPLRKMILAKHYSDHVMMEKIADVIWEHSVLSYVEIDCFIPIPLHWTRNIKRGFNQAEIIAQKLGKYKQVPMMNLLQRNKKTAYQAQLEKTERTKNVAGAFSLKKTGLLRGRHVVLVDDLCTTGSTAREAAKVLLKEKPASISLIVACRAI